MISLRCSLAGRRSRENTRTAAGSGIEKGSHVDKSRSGARARATSPFYSVSTETTYIIQWQSLLQHP
jgi:hypothetical protein